MASKRRLEELLLEKARRQATDWTRLARPNQLPPEGDWFVWLILAGRGWGKTRTGAEYVKAGALRMPGSRFALVAQKFADVRDTMVEGESGLLSILPPSMLRGGTVESAWNRSLGELTLANGSTFKGYSSERAGQLRGPQHHGAWCDEAAKWNDANLGTADDTTWSNLLLGLRLGDDPRCVVTTTPKPYKLIRDLVAGDGTVVTKGTTYENLDNLAPAFRANVLSLYEGTRLGRQELHAELLDDVPGALWTRADIEAHRVTAHPDLVRVVVAIDPSVTSNEDSDEAGIVVAGRGVDGDAYVLADVSRRDSPLGWARAAVAAYHTHVADRIVAEVNNGGDMVEVTLRTVEPTVPYRTLHASRGKVARAEPIAALYEQGRVHHVGSFDALEDQMCSYVPGGDSPDRMDALVWAITDLGLAQEAVTQLPTSQRYGGGHGEARAHTNRAGRPPRRR